MSHSPCLPSFPLLSRRSVLPPSLRFLSLLQNYFPATLCLCVVLPNFYAGSAASPPHLLSRLPSDSLNPYYLYQHAISIGHVFIFMTAQIDLLTFIYYVRSDVCMCARGGRRTICRKWFSASTTVQVLRRLKLMVSGLVASALTAWATSVVPQRLHFCTQVRLSSTHK